MKALKAFCIFIAMYMTAWTVDFINGERFEWQQVLVCAIVCALCAVGWAAGWLPTIGDGDNTPKWMRGRRY